MSTVMGDSQIESAERNKKIAEQQYTNDLRAVLATAQGTRVILKLMKDNFAFATTFDKHSSVMAKKAGRREVMIELLEDIERVDPAAVARLYVDSRREN